MVDLCYCGDIMERVKAVVLPSDLVDALKYFKEKTGKDATRVEVSAKVAPIIQGVMPDGVELLPHGGIMTYEIWLTALPKPFSAEVVETPAPNPTLKQHDTPQVKRQRVSKVVPVKTVVPVLQKSPVKVKKVKKLVRHGVMGRPPKLGKVSRTTLWRRAKKLKKMGERLL